MRYQPNTTVEKGIPGLYALKTDLFSVLVDPLDPETYDANKELAALGSLSLARINSTAAVVSRHSENFVNPDFKRYSFLAVLEGEMILSYHHGVTEFKAGQFLFVDNTYPRSMFVQKSISLLIISLPGLVLERYFPVPQQQEGILLGISVTPVGPKSDWPFDMILDNWDKIRQGALRDFAPILSDRLLRQLAEAYARHFNRNSCKRAARICQAKSLIEERLCDPHLSVEGLASELHVSSRYLRALFAPTEKLSHYILRRRLEESAQRLAASRYQELSISEIAYSCGFNTVAHFCRSFKKHYQVRPRDYRRAQVRQQGHNNIPEP